MLLVVILGARSDFSEKAFLTPSARRTQQQPSPALFGSFWVPAVLLQWNQDAGKSRHPVDLAFKSKCASM